METKKRKSLSAVALAISVLPLATFIPTFLKIPLSGGAQTLWAGANVLCIVFGLILSVICVRDKESRSIVNIISTAISGLWLLLMAGIVALALMLNILG